MFERPGGGSQAVLVSLDFGDDDHVEVTDELCQLAISAGLQIAAILHGKRRRPDPALFAGRGKVEELAEILASTGASLVLFNHELSPAQQRNLEQRLRRTVIDRVSLILGIFARHARSYEGKLQVELAQLEHLATRLVRGWTHLERQKGGIGLRGGPGETQLETDRRLLAKRVKILKDKLAKLAARRAVQRRARRRANAFAVSLVGYTNAGKSTLFNRLTRADTYVADQLFATLDTTTRRLHGLGETPIVLSDTVGFIRQLPHTLVAAFRATLEEAIEADLLLHVIDANNPARAAHVTAVNTVLAEIGADHIPQLLVYNKIDLSLGTPRVERGEYDKIRSVWISAVTGAGLDVLKVALTESAALSMHSTAVRFAAA